MRIPEEVKIEKACTDDKTRAALQNPYLKGDQIIATNGMILAVAHVEHDEEEKLVDGYVPIQAIKASRKAKRGMSGVLEVKKDRIELPFLENRPSFERNPEDLTFPKTEAITQKFPGGSIKVRFNPQLLARLAEAIGSEENIVLEIPLSSGGGYEGGPEAKGKPHHNAGPWKVTPGKKLVDPRNYGYLMPCRLDD